MQAAAHVGLVALVSCSSAPPLPPPPAEDLRASWSALRVELAPSPLPAGERTWVTAPPSTFGGRIATGGFIGGRIGLGSGLVLGAYGAWPAPFVLTPLGWLGGGVVGPFLGEAGDVVDMQAAALTQQLAMAAPDRQIRNALADELAVRGCRVAEDAPFRLEVRFDRIALEGARAFDPQLALDLRGGVAVVRASDGQVVFALPFQWRSGHQAFSQWVRGSDLVARAAVAGGDVVAEAVADELLAVVDVAWSRP